MNNVEKCALCNQAKELQESHIIPKFIGKWLKSTSATGYLRQAVNPNLRTQDLFKLHLLCHECEEKFSVHEKKFFENIFTPFQNSAKEFRYEEWLIRFIISMSWRTAFTELKDEGEDYLPLQKEVIKALEVWRKYLNNESNNRGKYKHHIFFLDSIDSVKSTAELIEKSNWYFLRTIDATIAYTSKNIFIYTKLPGIIIVSHVIPENMKGWVGTKVENKGKIKIPQNCNVDGFGEFLNHRIKLTNELSSKMTDTQKNKIAQSIKGDAKRLENSKSFNAILADLELENEITKR